PYETLIEAAAKQMEQGGAFLVTGSEANPMTIGWCQWGRLWNKPVCTVFVRQSRYSHELIENGRFTVSVPAEGTMKQELAFCGSKSGRDVNKRTSLHMQVLPSKTGGVDGIAGCAIQFECKTLLKLEMDGHLPELDEACRSRFYNMDNENGDNGDPHTVYFAEILAAYRS
ncbi:MAG: flavin reductase, partial [Eubacteriales bacterium]|nr:flavin reductase [Eubacteriales bacterium]